MDEQQAEETQGQEMNMVYVDRLTDWGWKLGPSSHMIADTEEELHAFAARVGLKRAWAQRSRSGVPHYDLTARRREVAVRLGAMDCQTTEEMQKFVEVISIARGQRGRTR